MSTFKRGDVAVVTGLNGQTWRAIRTGDDKWSLDCDWASCLSDDLVTEPRPLVVIDPEDAEQVERLVERMARAKVWAVIPESIEALHAYRAEQMQAALREFADPKPRIEEPTGLGAVVRDEDGRAWVRTNASPYPWACADVDEAGDRYVDECGFDDIDATEVLAAGWSE